MRAPAVLAASLALALVTFGAGAEAAPAEPLARTQLRIAGDAERFARLTGQRSTIEHSFIGWHQPRKLSKLLHQLRPDSHARAQDRRRRGAARQSHRSRRRLSRRVERSPAGFRAVVYVRPLPEMNAHWNEYSAFNKDGSPRAHNSKPGSIWDLESTPRSLRAHRRTITPLAR